MQRCVNGMEERLSENKDGGRIDMLFFFQDFLENSTRILMRSCTKASVQQLFCRICGCVLSDAMEEKRQQSQGQSLDGLHKIRIIGDVRPCLPSFTRSFLPLLLLIQYQNRRLSQATSSMFAKILHFPVFSALLCFILQLFSHQCKLSETPHWTNKYLF